MAHARILIVLASVVCGLIAVAPAAAQDSPSPTSIVGVLDQFRGLDTSGVIPTLTRAMATQIATFPIGSSSGGFTYRWNPAVQLETRDTHSFGPAFTERALGIGHGKVSAGMNYQAREL